MHPSAYIIAGPNGAGKTTFAREFLPNYAGCENFINADLIAEGISPFLPEAAAFRAGRLTLGEIGLYSERHEDFGFESTLSGRCYLNLIRKLRATGYQVHFFFLWVRSVELALARIRVRVLEGGHGVPEVVVRRRFDRSMRNFLGLYRGLADSWTMFDNSGATPSVIAFEKLGETRILEPETFRALMAQYGET